MLVRAASNRVRIAVIALAIAAHPLAAQPVVEAERHFQTGRDLLKAGKFADACHEFQLSEQLDPALGTEFNLAQCSEQIGKLARALKLYRAMVPRDTNDKRRDAAIAAIARLEPRVPKVVVRVPPGSAGAVTLEAIDSPLVTVTPGVAQEVDFGSYTVRFGSSTKPVVIDREAMVTTVELAQPPVGEPPPQPPTPRPVVEAGARRPLGRPLALASIGLGSAMVVGGLAFGAIARAQWNDAKARCGGTVCTDPDDFAAASQQRDKANRNATFSTTLCVAGGVLAAAGIVLYVVTPRAQIAAKPNGDGAVVTLSGRF